MKIELTEYGYNLLKTIDLSEMGEKLRLSDDEHSVYIEKKDIDLLQTIIEEEINVNGLSEDQQEVTPYGRDLYGLHDSFYIS